MSGRAGAALAVLALAAGLLAGCAAGGQTPEHRRVVPLAATPAEATGPLRPVPAGRLDHARPTALSVPAIGIDAPGLVELRRDSGGLLQMPPDGGTAGWSTLGPTPGALGPAVIAADGAGLFGRLAELAPGDEVAVQREDGTQAVFAVYRVARFDRGAVPSREVWGDTGGAELRLVTTGGVFDRDAEPGAGNLVAFARLAGVRG